MSGQEANFATRFPVYQIDFAAVAAGKRVASTKRRIRWRFGFPSKELLAAGRTGTDCRGQEHDVTIVWSVTSGKRHVSMDGREIHFSASRSGVLDFSWTTRGNHVLKIIAHAAPPISATPGFRQYDLLIDGQSFFSMPKVYELGIKGPIPSHARVPGSNDYRGQSSPMGVANGGGGGSRMYDLDRGDYVPQPASPNQEEADLQRAIQASLAETRQHLSDRGPPSDARSIATAPPPTAQSSDLLGGFDQPSVPYPGTPQASDMQSTASFNSGYSAPPTYNAPPPQGYPGQAPPYQSPPPIRQGAPIASPPGAIVPSQAPQGYYGAPPPQQHQQQQQYQQPPPQPLTNYQSQPPMPQQAPRGQPNFMNNAPPQGDVFGLQSSAYDDPFAPKPPPPPTHNDIASAILGAYSGSNPSTPAGGVARPTNQFPSATGVEVAPGQPQQNYPPQQGQYAPTNGGGAPGGSLTMHALQSNAEEEKPLSDFEKAMQNLVNVDHIDQPAEGEIKLTMVKKEAKAKPKKGKSKPLPPALSNMIGEGATLGQIKEVRPDGGPKDPSRVMKAPPASLFQAGAVNAGALVIHGQGPPPLQQATGFGIGARMPNGGFSQQQQKPLPQMMGGHQQGYPAQQGYQQGASYR